MAPAPFAAPSAAALLEWVRPGVVQVRAGRGGGAGVVWPLGDGRAWVVTNHHVVPGPRVELAVPDGRRLEARVADREPMLDLALLEVEAELAPVPVGDSRRLRVGELVYAVGHPWGRPWEVTGGVVSGLGRLELPGGRAGDFVRSDVALAPGNSGGPLLNALGEVVGVNAMVVAGRLGVAVPSHVAAGWLAGLRAPRVHLGVSVPAAGLPVVVGLEPGGPAARAGLMVGDLLLSVAGREVRGPEELRAALDGPGGGRLSLGVLRGGAARQVEVTWARRPEPRPGLGGGILGVMGVFERAAKLVDSSLLEVRPLVTRHYPSARAVEVALEPNGRA
jgi:serine protease Do